MSLSPTPSRRPSNGKKTSSQKINKKNKVDDDDAGSGGSGSCDDSDDDGKDEMNVPTKKFPLKVLQSSSAKSKRKRFKSVSSDSQKSESNFYNTNEEEDDDDDDDDDDDISDDDDDDDSDSDDNNKSVNSATEGSENKSSKRSRKQSRDGKFELLKSNSCDDDIEDDDVVDDDVDDNDNEYGNNNNKKANGNGSHIIYSNTANIQNNIDTRGYKRSYSISNLSCFSQDESGDFLTDNDYYSNPETFGSNSSSVSSASAETRSTSSASSTAATVSSNASISTTSSFSVENKHADSLSKSLYHLKKMFKRLMYPSFVTVYGFFAIAVSIALTIFTCFLLSSTMISRAKKQSISSYIDLSERHRDVVTRRLIQVENFALAQAGVPEIYQANSSYDTTKIVAFMLTFLNSFENGYSCSITRSNGNFFGAYIKDGSLSTSIASDETNNLLCTYVDDEYKNPCTNPEEGYNALTKPWYVALGNSTSLDDALWLGFFEGPSPLYIYAAPAIDSGVNIGVSTVSMLYEQIGSNIISYPESSDSDNSDIIFGIDLANGAFLGSYGLDNEVPCVRDDGTTKRKSLPITSANDPDILDAVDVLYNHWGSSWNSSKVNDTTIVTKYGKTISAAIVERPGLRWAVVMIGFRDNNKSAIDDAIGPGIIFFVFLVSIIAIGTSINLMTPVATLSHDMTVVSKLKFAEVTDRRGFSGVKEIRIAQESFRRVAVGIESLSKYAPSAVIRDVMRSGMRVSPHLDRMSPVAIMFVDIVDLSSIIETLSPKTQSVFSRLLTRWFREFCTIIQNTRGMIDKFIGGGIIALYGVPHKIRGPEMAASYAAVEFRAAIKRVNRYGEYLSRKYGIEIPTLTYRVGIHSGSVRAGHLGYSDHLNYTAIGPEMVVASKMEQLGKKFHVTPLVTGTVARRISSQYLCIFLYLIPYPGYNGEYVRVCHLVGRKKDIPKKYFSAAEVFRKIHAAVQDDDKQRALMIIKAAMGIEKFKMYVKALKCLYQSINDGGISKNVYSNESSYYSTSNSGSSYSQVSSSKDEN